MAQAEATTFDVAVILGAAVDGAGRASPALLRRVAHGVGLFHGGRVGHLLMSGGGARPGHREAMVMREAAMAAGVPHHALLVEDQSRSTLENARFCKPIIEANAWRRIVVVTDGYHLPRALYTFRRLGVAAAGEAAAPPPNADLLRARLREAGAFLCYLWRVERCRRNLR